MPLEWLCKCLAIKCVSTLAHMLRCSMDWIHWYLPAGSGSEPQRRRRDTATPGPGTPTATPRPGSYSVSDVARAYNVPGVVLPNGSAATGAGQNIALVEYSTFNGTNISNWATSTVGPCLTPGTQAACASSIMSRLTVIPVGSSLGAAATAMLDPPDVMLATTRDRGGRDVSRHSPRSDSPPPDKHC